METPIGGPATAKAVAYTMALARTRTITFRTMGTAAGKRRFWRMFSGEPTYRYPGGPPLIHKGRKGKKP